MTEVTPVRGSASESWTGSEVAVAGGEPAVLPRLEAHLVLASVETGEPVEALVVGDSGRDDPVLAQQRDRSGRRRLVRLVGAVGVDVQPDPVPDGVAQRGDPGVDARVDVRRTHPVGRGRRPHLRLADPQGERRGRTGVVRVGVRGGVLPGTRRGEPEPARHPGEADRVRAGRQVVEAEPAGTTADGGLDHVAIDGEQLHADPRGRRLALVLSAGAVHVLPHLVTDREAGRAATGGGCRHGGVWRRRSRPCDRHRRDAQPNGLVASSQVHRSNERGERLTGGHRRQLGQVGRDIGTDQVLATGQSVGAGEDELTIIVGDPSDARSRGIGDRDLDPRLRRIGLAVVGAVAVLVPVDQDREGAVGDLGVRGGRAARPARHRRVP